MECIRFRARSLYVQKPRVRDLPEPRRDYPAGGAATNDDAVVHSVPRASGNKVVRRNKGYPVTAPGTIHRYRINSKRFNIAD